MSQAVEPVTKKSRKLSKKKIVLLVLLVVFGPFGIIVPLAYSEMIRDVTVQNPSGATGTAFVVVRPGVSWLPDQVASQVALGLINQGWRVETTTPSSATPTNMTGYNLVVLVSPVYGSHPHPSMVDWLGRTNLQNLPVVLLLTSAGKQSLPMQLFKEATVAAGGRVVDEVLIGAFDWNGLDIAYQAGNNASLATA
jgi:hypothetical protein